MVYINKVYTKVGDAGTTYLASGDTVDKNDLRVCAYGELDELNAAIGVLLAFLQPPSLSVGNVTVSEIHHYLTQVQQQLFNLGAELASPKQLRDDMILKQRHVQIMEQAIDALNEPLEPLRSFILPGGGKAAAYAHVARTQCRRAERAVVTLHRQLPVRPEVLQYINRLSDYLFVAARALARSFGEAEVLWQPESV